MRLEDLVVRIDEADKVVSRDVYIVKEDIFDKLYSCIEQDTAG